MRLHIGEKIKQQKAMLISGKKYRPLMEDRVQRMAVYLMIGFLHSCLYAQSFPVLPILLQLPLFQYLP